MDPIQEEQLQPLEETQVEENNSTENKGEDPYKNETPSDTVKRALADLQSESDGDTDKEDKADSKVIRPAQNKSPQNKAIKQLVDDDPELLPPDRLKPHEKEAFNKSSKAVRKAIHRTIKDLEGMGTTRAQDVAKKELKYKEIEEVVEPLLVEWGQMHLSPAQGMRELVAAQKSLTDPDDNKREAAARRMLKNIRMEKLLAPPSNGAAPNPAADISNHPDFVEIKNQLNLLRQEIEPVKTNYQQQVQSQTEQGAAKHTEAMNPVINEVDRNGKYLRPELHDDNYLVNTAGPLVLNLMKAVPGLDAGEALKRVYSTLTGNFHQSSPQATQTRPLANSTQSIQQRATQAAVTVRGKSSPPSSVNDLDLIPDDVLRNQNPLQTMQMLASKMSRGF